MWQKSLAFLLHLFCPSSWAYGCPAQNCISKLPCSKECPYDWVLNYQMLSRSAMCQLLAIFLMMVALYLLLLFPSFFLEMVMTRTLWNVLAKARLPLPWNSIITIFLELLYDKELTSKIFNTLFCCLLIRAA